MSKKTLLCLLALAIVIAYVVIRDKGDSPSSTSPAQHEQADDGVSQPVSFDLWTDDPDFDDAQLVALSGQPSQVVRYPGFILSFNAQHHIPNWVAWELTGDEVRANVATRSDGDFAPDNSVRGCADLRDYRSSGYTRGHMCPASDMRWSKQAMRSCFMLTNMCPQTADLNAGAWNTLEVSCRKWAKRDSALYIICGPVLTDVVTRTIGRGRVTVPERFFKVVLAPYSNPPRAIGFVMPNGYFDGGMNAAAMSVDQVEQITGYDFFAFLPDDIEDAVESQCNLPLWNKRR